METEKLAEKIIDLEHFLFDVWDWITLCELGQKFVSAEMERRQEHGDPYLKERDLERRLWAHLQEKYTQAIEKVDEIAATIKDVPSVLTEPLLERVQLSLGRLKDAEGCRREFEKRIVFNPSDWLEEPDWDEIERAQSGEESVFFEEIPDLWTFIASDLGHYAAKVAQRVEGHRTKVAPTTTGPEPLRIKWITTTAAFVHVMDELVNKEYMEVPGRNGKEGERNQTELIRRLLQAFEVTGEKTGKPLSVEQLRQRFQSARQIAFTKGLRIELPEAKEL